MSNDDLELNQFIKNLHQEVIINSEGNRADEDSGSFRKLTKCHARAIDL